MNKKTFSAVALATLLLTACQNDEETMQTDTRVALQVTSGIQTRAYDDQWEEKDDIGIFGFTQGDAPTQAYSNVRYVTRSGDGAFTPDGTTIYLPAYRRLVFGLRGLLSARHRLGKRNLHGGCGEPERPKYY